MRRFIRDITFMLDISVGIYWKFCWGFFIPVALIAIFVYALYSFERLKYAGVPYPDAAMCKQK
jgi:solute carrier family 6 amino acid transporter-like protein 5/7/9/14